MAWCPLFMDEFEITIEGVPYPFFQEEFPHPVAFHKQQFEET